MKSGRPRRRLHAAIVFVLGCIAVVGCGAEETRGQPSQLADAGDSRSGDDASDGPRDGEGDAAAGGAGGAAAEGGACDDEQAAIVAFVQAHKGCNSSEDCTFVYSRSKIREHCSGGFYLNENHNAVEQAALESVVESCLGPDDDVCAMLPPPATCWHGVCTANDDRITARDACLAEYGESACTVCACGVCFPACKDIPACATLFSCALQSGCLGTTKCDPTASDFPCQAFVASAGGTSSWAVQSFALENTCMLNWQCAPACSDTAKDAP